MCSTGLVHLQFVSIFLIASQGHQQSLKKKNKLNFVLLCYQCPKTTEMFKFTWVII